MVTASLALTLDGTSVGNSVDFTYCSRSALAKAEENKTIRGEAQEIGVRGAVAKS